MSKVPEPPNYRKATGKHECGNCSMFDKGLCWGYGNRKVDEDAVCDSWATDELSKSANLHDDAGWVICAKDKDELHVGLDIPEVPAREIEAWVNEQDWPEGTNLEPIEEYHITILYSPEGHEEHSDDEWLDHKSHAVTISGIDAFDTQEDKGDKAIVLRIDSETAKEHAEDMQDKAEANGLEIKRFPGGYKCHLTIAYGPGLPEGVKPPELTFETELSAVSVPRLDEEIDESKDDDEENALDRDGKDDERDDDDEHHSKKIEQQHSVSFPHIDHTEAHEDREARSDKEDVNNHWSIVSNEQENDKGKRGSEGSNKPPIGKGDNEQDYNPSGSSDLVEQIHESTIADRAPYMQELLRFSAALEGDPQIAWSENANGDEAISDPVVENNHADAEDQPNNADKQPLSFKGHASRIADTWDTANKKDPIDDIMDTWVPLPQTTRDASSDAVPAKKRSPLTISSSGNAMARSRTGAEQANVRGNRVPNVGPVTVQSPPQKTLGEDKRLSPSTQMAQTNALSARSLDSQSWTLITSREGPIENVRNVSKRPERRSRPRPFTEESLKKDSLPVASASFVETAIGWSGSQGKNEKRKQSDSWSTREWPDSLPTFKPGPSDSDRALHCTCQDGHKLDCPVHGMFATEQDHDHSWSIPENSPVGYPQDQPRNYQKADN